MNPVSPLKCKVCDEYASPGAQIFFALASDIGGQKDFTCNKCEHEQKEILEQTKDVERSIPWAEEMELTGEHWTTHYEQRSKTD